MYPLESQKSMKFSTMQHKDRLPDDERKARRLAASARYREKNLEKCREAARLSQAKRRLESDAVRDADKAYKETEAYKEQQRKYREENREMLNAGAIAWRLENPDRYAEYQRQYQELNREQTRARTTQWRKDNPERASEYGKAWRETNPGEHTRHEQNRRARIKVSGGELSPGLYSRLMKIQRGKCVACGCDIRKLAHMDHIMPLARGGANTDDNIQLLCQPCNNTKHAKHPIDFMQSRGFLL